MKPSTTSRKKYLIRALAVLFWLGVWQIASMLIGQEILLVSPVVAVRTLWAMLGEAAFYRRVLSSFGRILHSWRVLNFPPRSSSTALSLLRQIPDSLCLTR